jgi:hypothetical protein
LALTLVSSQAFRNAPTVEISRASIIITHLTRPADVQVAETIAVEIAADIRGAGLVP